MEAAIDVNRAAGVKREGESRSFIWAAFFSNRYTIIQMILYALIFYATAAGLDDVRPVLARLLLLLPLFLLNLIGTHLLRELIAKREKHV